MCNKLFYLLVFFNRSVSTSFSNYLFVKTRLLEKNLYFIVNARFIYFSNDKERYRHFR